MKEKFAAYFSRFMSLTQEEKEAIMDSAQIREFKKGSILLRAGQISQEAYFVLKGCMRQYYLKGGEEKTTHFFTEEQWVISLQSFSQQMPSDHYIACVEDCSLVVGNQEGEQELYQRFPKFERLSRQIIEAELAQQQARMAAYITDSPEQRYLNLLESHPELIQRVPQYQLASYIGVKPESLSRIRKRIFSKKSKTPKK